MRTIQYGLVNSAMGQIPCSTERISGCYVLPVLWMTSCFYIILERIGRIRDDVYVSSSSPCGGTSRTSDDVTPHWTKLVQRLWSPRLPKIVLPIDFRYHPNKSLNRPNNRGSMSSQAQWLTRVISTKDLLCWPALFSWSPARDSRRLRTLAGSTARRMRAAESRSTSGVDCLRLPRPRFPAAYIQACCVTWPTHRINITTDKDLKDTLPSVIR